MTVFHHSAKHCWPLGHNANYNRLGDIMGIHAPRTNRTGTAAGAAAVATLRGAVPARLGATRPGLGPCRLDDPTENPYTLSGWRRGVTEFRVRAAMTIQTKLVIE